MRAGGRLRTETLRMQRTEPNQTLIANLIINRAVKTVKVFRQNTQHVEKNEDTLVIHFTRLRIYGYVRLLVQLQKFQVLTVLFQNLSKHPSYATGQT